MTGEEIVEWSRTQMASYKIPRRVEFVETLPKSASGKVMWRALQDKQDAIECGALPGP